MKKRKKLLIIIFIVIVLIVGFFWWKNSQQNTEDAQSTTVVKGTLQETLTLSGEIDASEKAILRFQSGGRVSWIGVKEGDTIHKHQAIAGIDQRSIQMQLQKYLNTFTKERLDFEQDHSDYEDTAHIGLTQEIRDEAKRLLAKSQYDLNNSVLDVELQDLALHYATLTSPIDGIIVRVDSPQAGVNISAPTQAEFEVVNPESIYLSLLADQTEVTKLTASAAGSFVLDSYPESTMSGYIKTIGFAPKQNESGTVYPVRFVFNADNYNFRYRMGMTGDVTFVTNEKTNVLYIPSEFVHIEEETSAPYVNVDVNGKTQKRTVTTGMETDDYTEITSGLSEGETVYD